MQLDIREGVTGCSCATSCALRNLCQAPVAHYANDIFAKGRTLQAMQQPKTKVRKRRHYLPEWAETYGFSPAQFIEVTGADKSVVSRWLGKTRSEPSADYLEKLATLFEVSTDRFYSAPPAARELERVSDDDEYDGVGFVDGKVQFAGKVPGSLPETLAAGGMGPGRLDGSIARVQTHGIATGHAVAAEWVIPPSFLRHGLGGRPDTTIIVPVIGHSMEPRLLEGDRVIVDVSQNVWVADAIYAIAFDDDNFQVKTIKMDRTSKPPMFRIISESSPADEDRLAAHDFRIVGRVVGRISRP